MGRRPWIAYVSYLSLCLLCTSSASSDEDGMGSGDAASEGAAPDVPRRDIASAVTTSLMEPPVTASSTPDCNRTETVTSYTRCMTCQLTSHMMCPVGTRKITTGKGINGCRYQVKLYGSQFKVFLTGCRHQCDKEELVEWCCPGTWGPDCQDCPRGPAGICGGHGKCSDGAYGDGSCACQGNFVGTACEACASLYYGEDCSQACECVHGICNDNIHGDGSCDCASGYQGLKCEEAIPTCATTVCPAHFRCDQGAAGPRCVCAHGYASSAGDCISINPCERDPDLCSPQADCTHTGPGQSTCQCREGYNGSGVVCFPVDPCQVDLGGCPWESTSCSYTGPGQRLCECLPGYTDFIEEVGCTLVDVCRTNTSLCHENANCTTTGPDLYECICDVGYTGDGKLCYGNLLVTMRELNANSPVFKGKLNQSIQLMEYTYHQAFTEHGPITIFAPTDAGFAKSRRQTSSQLDVDSARWIQRQHMIASQLTVDEMKNGSTFYTLAGSPAKLVYRNGELNYKVDKWTSKATILQSNIVAANGYIHIVDRLLDIPNYSAKSKTTIGSTLTTSGMIATELYYSVMGRLVKQAGLDTSMLNLPGPWTVLVPASNVWHQLPPHTIDYLMSKEGEMKLLALLRNHIIRKPTILASDLINMQRFVSIGNTATTVALTQWGQIKLNGNINMTLTDEAASNGVMHHIDGVLIPSSIEPLLPHRCDLENTWTVRGKCGPCYGDLHCPGKDDIPLNATKPDCQYRVHVGDTGGSQFVSFPGCARMCNRTYTIEKCCSGFYGDDCHPCPGGFQNPCYGRGKCVDGIMGNGSCSCDPIYKGAICEFCSNASRYGLGCNQTCNCLYGSCDNRVLGSAGLCRRRSCRPGYTGIRCDLQARACSRSMRCHAHASCVRTNAPSSLDAMKKLGSRRRSRYVKRMQRMRKRKVRASYKCVCKQGYSGSGYICNELDPCAENRGGCHVQATCTKTGPGNNTCRCDKGWVGDGLYCYPSSSCSQHNDCHDNARCVPTYPGEHVCVCQKGFHGNGSHCLLENVCLENNGGCHINASCTPSGPGQANCSCAIDMGGDGLSCYGTIAYEVGNSPVLTRLQGLIQELPDSDDFLTDVDSSFTLLAPSDTVLSRFVDSARPGFFKDQPNIVLLLGYHALAAAVSMETLRDVYANQTIYTLAEPDLTLNVTSQGEDLYINGAKVVQGNIPAINGYIHIIDKVLEPYPISAEPPLLQELLEQNPDLSIFKSYLEDMDMLDALDDLTQYTLFVPSNQCWKAATQRMSRRLLSYYIIPDEVLTWAFSSNGVNVSTLLGSSPQQQLRLWTDTDGQAFVNNAKVTEKNLLTMGGVVHVIDRLLETDVARCDEFANETIMGLCTDCAEVRCPDGYLASEPHLVANCTYYERVLIAEERDGCQLSCQRVVQAKRCCDGFYGDDCQECPGGMDKPCSFHGDCSDGVSGSGYCTCDANFTGSACENCMLERCRGRSCEVDNGGCDVNAQCQDELNARDEPEPLCFCNDGFIRYGIYCNSDLLTTLSTLPDTSAFYGVLVQSDNRLRSLSPTELIAMLGANVTVFVPITARLHSGEGVADPFQYIVADQLYLIPSATENSSDVANVGGTTMTLTYITDPDDDTQGSYRLNGVEVVETNVPTTEGALHLLASPLPVNPTQSQHEGHKSSSGRVYLLAGCGLALAVLGVLGLVTWRYRHKVRELFSKLRRNSLGADFTFHRFTPEDFNVVRFRPGDSAFPDTQPPVCDVTSSREGCFDNPAFCADSDDNSLILTNI